MSGLPSCNRRRIAAACPFCLCKRRSWACAVGSLRQQYRGRVFFGCSEEFFIHDPGCPAADSRSLAGRLTPLLVAAACLLGANGLSVTMISVRAKSEGMSDALIGLLGSCYFGGMIVGVLLTPFLIARAGHIRVFSTLAAISAIAILAIAFTPAGWLWMVVRLVSGAAFAARRWFWKAGSIPSPPIRPAGGFFPSTG